MARLAAGDQSNQAAQWSESCTRGPGQGVRGMGMSGATSADRGVGDQ